MISSHSIESYDISVLSMPLREPFRMVTNTIVTVDAVVLRLYLKSGLVGNAYLFSYDRRLTRILAELCDWLVEAIQQSDISDPEACWRLLNRSITLVGPEGLAMMAVAAVDVAIWDLKAKSLGVPLWRLLDRPGEGTAVYGSGGGLGSSIDALLREATDFVAMGCGGYKMKVGQPRLREDVERVRSVREAIGPGVALIADANQGWDYETAIRFADEIADLDLLWLEEPLAVRDKEANRLLRSRLSMPLAGGENEFGSYTFQGLVESDSLDIIMPNLQRSGGITGWLEIAEIAARSDCAVSMHLFCEIAAQLMDGLPNGGWVEYLPWWDRMMVTPHAFDGGKIRPPATAGVGLEFDESAVKRYSAI
ncbi:mandelate racemase/muconate lactonizing enzyme family protein [Microbaculum marinum]|uniref:Mandelate racemase/muconate lactonizing enzyme family protein n=1 Tax=Microbaculum marinum TaxID=1764581 RepID=A0AAW9RKK6_9HYPH